MRQHKIANPSPPTLRVLAEDEPALAEDAEEQHKAKDPLHINDPRDLIALHWANPHVRPHIELYLTFMGNTNATKPLKEIWDSGKFDTLPLSALPPMWEHPASKKHYYVGELATERSEKRAWIPLRWMRDAATGDVFAEATPVRFNTNENVRN